MVNITVKIDLSPVSEPKTALLLEKEPANLQAQSLAVLIDQGVARGKHILVYHV